MAAVQVGGVGAAMTGFVCSRVEVAAVMVGSGASVKVAAVVVGSGTSVKVVAVIKAAMVVVQLQW